MICLYDTITIFKSTSQNYKQKTIMCNLTYSGLPKIFMVDSYNNNVYFVLVATRFKVERSILICWKRNFMYIRFQLFMEPRQ